MSKNESDRLMAHNHPAPHFPLTDTQKAPVLGRDRALRTFLATILVAVCIFSAVAQTPRKEVVIPVFEFPTLMDVDANGLPVTGYAYDYIQTIAGYAGWKVKYIPVSGFAYGLDLLEKGEADLFFDITRTPERARRMLFPDEPMGRESTYLYAMASNRQTFAELASLNGKTVGVTRGSLQAARLDHWCREKGLSVTCVGFDGLEMQDALLAGRIDLCLEIGMLNDARFAAITKVSSQDYYLVANTNRTDLLDDINSALAKIQATDPFIFARLSEDYFTDTAVGRTLMPEERAWLAAHHTVRVGYFEGYHPLSATDKDGKPTGAMVDVMPAILRALDLEGKLKIEYVAYNDQRTCFADVAAGKIDLMFPSLYNDAVLHDFSVLAGRPVISFPHDLAYKGDYTRATEKRIAVVNRNLIQDYYTREAYPRAEIVYYDTIEECIEAVADGRCGSTVLNGFRTDYLLRKTGHPELNSVKIDLVYNCRMIFGTDNAALMMLMDRGVGILGRNEPRHILFDHLGNLFEPTVGEFLHRYLAAVLSGGAALLVLLLGLLVLVRRKHLQAARSLMRLTAAERDRRLLFENMPYPAFAFSPEGKILVANAAAGTMVGEPGAEIVGRACREVLCDGVGRPDWCPLVPGAPDVENQVLTRRDGTSYLISVKHVFDEKGKLAYLLETAMDITHRHEEVLNAQFLERGLSAAMSDEMLKYPAPLLKVIRARLDADVCYLRLGVGSGLNAELAAGAVSLRGGRTNNESWGFDAEAARGMRNSFATREPVAYTPEELATLRRMFRASAGKAVFDSLASVFVLRIDLHGKAYGVVVVGYSTARTLTDLQLEFLRRCAQVLEAAVERTETHDLIRASNESLRFKNDLVSAMFKESNFRMFMDFVALKLLAFTGAQHIVMSTEQGERTDWFSDNASFDCRNCARQRQHAPLPDALFKESDVYIVRDAQKAKAEGLGAPDFCPAKCNVFRQLRRPEGWWRIVVDFTATPRIPLEEVADSLSIAFDLLSMARDRELHAQTIDRQVAGALALNDRLRLERDQQRTINECLATIAGTRETGVPTLEDVLDETSRIIAAGVTYFHAVGGNFLKFGDRVAVMRGAAGYPHCTPDELKRMRTDEIPVDNDYWRTWRAELDAQGQIMRNGFRREGRTFALWNEVMAREGIGSFCAVKLMLNGRLWGEFALHFAEDDRTLSDDERKMLANFQHLIEMLLMKHDFIRSLAAEKTPNGNEAWA